MSLWCDIDWYAAAKLDAMRKIIDVSWPSEGFQVRKTLRASEERPPLLLFALDFAPNINLPDRNWYINNNILELILCRGGNPNDSFRGHTLWEYTITWAHMTHMVAFQTLERAVAESLVKTFTIMLENGADPNACCIRGCIQNTSQTRVGPHNTLHGHVPVKSLVFNKLEIRLINTKVILGYDFARRLRATAFFNGDIKRIGTSP